MLITHPDDIFTNFSPDLLEILKVAVEKAKLFNSPYIDPDHIFLAILEAPSGFNLIEHTGMDAKKIQDEVFKDVPRGDFHGQGEFSSVSMELFQKALEIAKSEKKDYLEPHHVILQIIKDNKTVASKVLQENKIDEDKIKKAAEELAKKSESETEEGSGEEDKKTEGQNDAGHQTKSELETYTIDLTAKAKAGQLDPVLARDAEIERVMEILTRRTKNNPVLIGEAGVGKTAIVEGLAQKIASGQVPDQLKNKRVLILDLSLMVAGAKHRGEFEERLEKVIKEIKAAAGSIILFIDELHTIMGAGAGEGSLDAANILKPSLARGEMQTIGATTIKEFRQYIEKDAAFERRFQRVMVNEPTIEQAILILNGIKSKYEEHHKVKIPEESVEAAVKLSERYISDRFLPDKAIDVIDEAGSKIELKNINPRDVTVNLVKEIVSATSGIPITKLDQDESSVLLNLEDLIHKRLVDQENAVKVICEAIRRNRAGLKNPKRPVGSFIFMGPTGVGKTQLAKTLAEVLFGKEDKMVRIDMSEYMEKNSTARMIGAPPGYVGYEEGGQLTEAVRKNPYSVVLFDEIEKAHKDVFNIFLQILDDGRLTDNKGRTVDFKNTIIICTSNVGTELIQKSNIDDPNLQKQLMNVLLETFRPEFINRFDEVVTFRGLRPQDMAQIAAVMIKDIEDLLKEQKITLEISERAKLKLAEIGYDAVYGARPLRRIIQREIENPLSLLMIKETVKENQSLLVDLDKDQKFIFYNNEKANPAPQPPKPEEKKPTDQTEQNFLRDETKQDETNDKMAEQATSE
ncbi:MAG: ATP-dependent Clp protease ATP-binding subunit [Candidatus Berkelbacteria bacterium]|nr:ATP-dependent Clp protease ATP-binding subunit [Candidatus Berkelbacteria bacterium]